VLHDLTYSIVAAALVFAQPAWSASISDSGAFADFFSSVDIEYSSLDPYDPGDFLPPLGGPLGAPVVGIDKFDPALGTLTEIYLEVVAPIFLGFGGGISATQVDGGLPFAVEAIVAGEAGVYYVDAPDTLVGLETDDFDVYAGCGGGPGDGGCSSGVDVGFTDGMVVGPPKPISGMVDLADFIGAGEVEVLSVAMFLQSGADFMPFGLPPDNVDEPVFFTVGYDVFDGIPGPTVEITYEYSPVPLPAPILMLGSAALVLMGVSRRKP
jgi:hypothetical protein